MVWICVLRDRHLLSSGGGTGSKMGGSTKNLGGMKGGLRKSLCSNREVYEKNVTASTVVVSLTRENAEIWGGLRKILDPRWGVYEKFSLGEGGL